MQTTLQQANSERDDAMDSAMASNIAEQGTNKRPLSEVLGPTDTELNALSKEAIKRQRAATEKTADMVAPGVSASARPSASTDEPVSHVRERITNMV